MFDFLKAICRARLMAAVSESANTGCLVLPSERHKSRTLVSLGKAFAKKYPLSHKNNPKVGSFRPLFRVFNPKMVEI